MAHPCAPQCPRESEPFPREQGIRLLSLSKSKLLKRTAQVALLSAAILALMGAGDQEARFQSLGHHMMCVCGCGQILLECNHVGCQYSDRMRTELMAALDRGDNDDLITQAFIQ